nr:hypothetical protein [Paraburkholderia fungorum]
MLARVEKGRARLFTSGGHDWTKKLTGLATEVERLPVTTAWLDGEIVVLRNGLPNFGALQDAIDGADKQSIVFFLFDAPFLDGKDLRGRHYGPGARCSRNSSKTKVIRYVSARASRHRRRKCSRRQRSWVSRD